MIEEIFPAWVACSESFGDPPDEELFPEDEALVATAVVQRRREFAAARGCARKALAALDVETGSIPRGDRGAPQWPPGIVGSITHCAGYRAAAVGRSGNALSIGLDAEPNEVLPDGVLEMVSLPAERARLGDLAAVGPGSCWDRLLFSAKETVYKTWFPLARRWLGFEHADVTINPADGSFEAQLLVEALTVRGCTLSRFRGRWLVRDGFILTAIAVPACSSMPSQLMKEIVDDEQLA